MSTHVKVRSLLTVALSVLPVFVAVTRAGAAPSVVPTETWVTDGRVYSILRLGERIYLGGSFTQVGPNTGFGLSIDSATGQRQGGPKVNGEIRVAVPDGQGGWFIGGSFTNVGGHYRPRLAHVLSSGLVASWTPRPNNTVSALATSGGTVYAGGSFTSVGGVTRNRLAAIDARTGEADLDWNPGANGTVYALAAPPDGSTLFAGGAFTNIAGTPRNRVAALNPATGQVIPTWSANASSNVRALAASSSRLYLGGDFTSVRGQPRTRLASVDLSTGTLDPSWTAGADRRVRGLALSSDVATVFAGGEFDTVSGQARSKLVALDAATGAVKPTWHPDPGYTVFGVAVAGGTVYAAGGGAGGHLPAYDVTTGLRRWIVATDGDVQAVAVWGSRVFAGGHFDRCGGETRRKVCAVDGATGTLDAWAPTVNSALGVWALNSTASYLYMGGDFTIVSGAVQQGFAEFLDPMVG